MDRPQRSPFTASTDPRFERGLALHAVAFSGAIAISIAVVTGPSSASVGQHGQFGKRHLARAVAQRGVYRLGDM